MARTTSPRPQRAKRIVIFEGNAQKRWRKLKRLDNRLAATHADDKDCGCYGKCSSTCVNYMRLEQLRNGFADDWDATDWQALIRNEILINGHTSYLAQLAFEELEGDEDDEPQPPKPTFRSQNKKAEPAELMSDEEHAMRAHVGWPSPAHKPRKPLPPDPENPYGKPRFKGNVPAQFRSTDSVGGMGYVRSGKVRKIG